MCAYPYAFALQHLFRERAPVVGTRNSACLVSLNCLLTRDPQEKPTGTWLIERFAVSTRWFKYDRDKLWLVYTQIVPVIFEPPCTLSLLLIYTHAVCHRQLSFKTQPWYCMQAVEVFTLLEDETCLLKIVYCHLLTALNNKNHTCRVSCPTSKYNIIYF